MVKKILCATDGSRPANTAADVAIELAKGLGVPLTFLSVSMVSPERAARSPFWDDVLMEEADAQLHVELHGPMERARKAGVKEADCAIAFGRNVVEAVLAYAKEKGYDHIVIGASGKTGLERVVLGSVSHGIIHAAECPVTVVRGA